MRRFVFIILCSASIFSWSIAEAVSATGLISMRVLRALTIQAKDPIQFSPAVPGSEANTIAPGDSSCGQFVVRGEANTAYQIRLPSQVTLTTNQGQSPNQWIKVSSFTSFPTGTGLLNPQGEQFLFVGATREPLRADQEEGTYSGTYLIDIIY